MGINMVKINLNRLEKTNYVRLNKKAVEYVYGLIKKTNLLIDSDFKDNIYRMKRGDKISLSFLKKLKNYLDVPHDFIEKNIILITSVKNTDIGIKNPKLPFNFNSIDGVRFLAAIMGDGELNKGIQVRYNNQDMNLINLVLNSAKKIFGDVDFKIYPRKDKTYQLHFPKIAGLCILALGIKPGEKARADNNIPKFIFKTDNRSKSAFIRQFFNDEGNVRLKDRRLQIKQTVVNKTLSKEGMKQNPEKYCPNVLVDIKRLLFDLDIYSRISLGAKRGNKSDWELSIYGKENLDKFQKQVGFDIDYKNEILNKSIKSYKFPSAPRNGRVEFAIKKSRIVEKKYGVITRFLLAKESKRSLKTATYYIVDLNKKKFLKRMGIGKYKLVI